MTIVLLLGMFMFGLVVGAGLATLYLYRVLSPPIRMMAEERASFEEDLRDLTEEGRRLHEQGLGPPWRPPPPDPRISPK